MKKGIILTTSSIVLILITLLILMITNVIPNPFLDTSDLVCVRKNYNYDEIVTFKFDRLGKSVFSNKVDHLYFDTNEEADEYYNEFSVDNSNLVKENDTTIIVNTPKDNEKEHYKKSRRKIKKLYTEYGFKCE